LEKKIILPALPKVHRARSEKLKTLNSTIVKNEPWTLGLVEAIGIVEIISKQKIDTKNRISLILLDSTFEISLKEFIVHRGDIFHPSKYKDGEIQRLFQNRHSVIKLIREHVIIPDNLIKLSNHYYEIRNKIIHERATVGISDNDIVLYKGAIEKILN